MGLCYVPSGRLLKAATPKVGRALYREELLASHSDIALLSYLSVSIRQEPHRAISKGGFSIASPSQSASQQSTSYHLCSVANALLGALRQLLHPISRHVSHHHRPQRRLDQQHPPFFPAPVRLWISADNHKPLPFARLPQRQLRTLIGMVREARVAHTQEVCVIGLPLHRVTRQGMISVLRRQHVLEDIDEGLFAGQSLLTREQEITESGITSF